MTSYLACNIGTSPVGNALWDGVSPECSIGGFDTKAFHTVETLLTSSKPCLPVDSIIQTLFPVLCCTWQTGFLNDSCNIVGHILSEEADLLTQRHLEVRSPGRSGQKGSSENSPPQRPKPCQRLQKSQVLWAGWWSPWTHYLSIFLHPWAQIPPCKAQELCFKHNA